MQIELDKTAEAFRQAHDERMEVLEQWENIIRKSINELQISGQWKNIFHTSISVRNRNVVEMSMKTSYSFFSHYHEMGVRARGHPQKLDNVVI